MPGRVFLIARLRPMLRDANVLTVIVVIGLLGMLAWQAADIVPTVSPYYTVFAFAFITFVFTLYGMPSATELQFLRAAAPARTDRIVYIGLSLAWSSCAPLVVGLLIPLFALTQGVPPPWWLSCMSIGVWVLFSVAGAIVVERFEIGKFGTNTTRGRSPAPAWYRKEAGLLLTRGADWIGPALAIASALATLFVFPRLPDDIHMTAARVTGLLLGPLLAEPFVLNITAAEGKRAWLHAVAQEPARNALLRKAFVGAVYVGMWCIPYVVALALTLPGTMAMSILLQTVTALIGACSFAFVLGTRWADLRRANRAQKLHPMHGLLVGAALLIHATIWIVNPKAGYLLTAIIVFTCALWLWRQKTFTSLPLWRNQAR